MTERAVSYRPIVGLNIDAGQSKGRSFSGW